MTIKVTDEMVNRFLCWQVPVDFAPDGGVTFVPVLPGGNPRPKEWWPTGTNLLTFVQARAMLEHVLADAQV